MLCFRGSVQRRSFGSTWYDRMDNLLMALGFTESKADSNLYFKIEGVRLMMLMLYDDDLFQTGEKELIIDAKRKLAAEFEMKDLGMMHYFLAMEVWKSANGIFLSQGKYVVEIMKRFRMLEYKLMATPMASNLKLLCDYLSETVDATMYRR